jgi:hypothetical protein
MSMTSLTILITDEDAFPNENSLAGYSGYGSVVEKALLPK